jgi:phosphoenolpyruvate carboxykinase (ATP)
MLGDRIARFGSKCWLVNTGWSGGAYGTGKRMAIGHTRGLLRAVLDGRLANAPMRKDENFGFLVPESCADVPAEVLDPRATWANKKAYDETARCLTRDFERNFNEYEPFVGNDIKGVAVHGAA